MSELKKQVILALLQNIDKWLVKSDMGAMARLVGEPTPTTTEEFVRITSMYVAFCLEQQAEMIIRYTEDAK